MQQDVSNILGQFLLVFHIAGKTLLGLSPYIFAGIFLAELLKNLNWIDKLKLWFYNETFKSVLVGTCLGVVSPLCTYGTVPVILMLVRERYPLPPLISFLVASSSINPQLFIVTWGGIGVEMALVRLGSVIIFSLLTGFILSKIPVNLILATERIDSIQTGDKNPIHQGQKTDFRRSMLSMWNDLKYIGFFIIIGCVLGALIEIFIPGDWIASLFNTGPFGSILVAALLGVPVYVCGGGTIPIIHSLLSKGMNIGAAFAFLSVGQAVRITPLVALATVMRGKPIMLYILAIIVYSVLVGLLYSSLN